MRFRLCEYHSVIFSEGRYPQYRYNDGEREWCIDLQRLTAYAHGEVDHIRFSQCGKEVHHIDSDPWNNSPENLQGLSPEEHSRESYSRGLGRA